MGTDNGDWRELDRKGRIAIWKGLFSCPKAASTLPKRRVATVVGVRALLNARVTIPQVFVAGELIGEATETLDAWKTARIHELLRKQGVAYDTTVSVEPRSFLPSWLAAR